MNSQTGTLNKVDWKKIAMHTGLVAIAAGLTYLSEHLTGVDLGNYSGIITAGLSILLKMVQRLVSTT